MASESSSERTVSIALPSELDDWLDEQATLLDVEREQLLVQLLASYRTVTEADKEADGSLLIDESDITDTVEEQLSDQLPAQLDEQVTDEIQGALDDRIQTEVQKAVEDALTGQVSEATNSVQRQLTNRIDTVEEEFDEKIADVRERVIQVKKETDTKAPADHHHEAFDTIDTLGKRVSQVEDELAELRTEFNELVPNHDETITDVSDRLKQMEERLQTVAWVVSDLRDAHESSGGLRAVERIKRAAAKADVERANCESCDEGVTIALLTDPKCPHCDSTVSNVEPAGGWFGKPKLLTASQLESGEES